MSFSSKNKLEKNFYKAVVLGGIIAMPFTGGLSLIASMGAGVLARRYNSFFQTNKERLEENIYDFTVDEYKKNSEIGDLKNISKNIENIVKNMNKENLVKIKNITSYPVKPRFLGFQTGETYMKVEVNNDK